MRPRRQRASYPILIILILLAFLATGEARGTSIEPYSGVERRSVYIPMRDGVRLAATIYTPKGLKPGERTPTVLQFTRYYRLIAVKPIWRPFFGFKPVAITEKHLRERLVRAGYSWVDVDVRGTGASFGTWIAPYDPETVRDGGEVLDWIARQPWSSGRVAAIGSSYNAALAVLQLSNEHPALKAVVSTFGIWDLADLRPGGLRMVRLVEPLSNFFEAMDRNQLGRLGWMPRLFARGVEPVDRDLLREAQQSRSGNTNLREFFANLAYRDDPIRVTSERREATTDAINPQAVVGRRSTVPVLTFGGWYDNAFAAGALRQFASTRAPGSHIRIGPWIHGIGAEMKNVSPYATSKQTWDGHASEVQRFLDRHLRGVTGMPDDAPVQYYVIGEERWRASETWPPAHASEETLYFGGAGSLEAASSSAAEASDRYVEDFLSSSGGSRWGFSLDGRFDRVFVRREQSPPKLLHYQTAPLRAPMTITGAPLLDLFIAADKPDPALFAYLEEIAPDGRVRQISEGELRLVNRQLARGVDLRELEPLHSLLRSDAKPMVPGQIERVVLRMLPTAYRVPAGHRLRVSVAATDTSSFFVLPEPLTYDVHRDAAHPSRIRLPITR